MLHCKISSFHPRGCLRIIQTPLNTNFWPHPQSLGVNRSGWGLIVCISNKWREGCRCHWLEQLRPLVSQPKGTGLLRRLQQTGVGGVSVCVCNRNICKRNDKSLKGTLWTWSFKLNNTNGHLRPPPAGHGQAPIFFCVPKEGSRSLGSHSCLTQNLKVFNV